MLIFRLTFFFKDIIAINKNYGHQSFKLFLYIKSDKQQISRKKPGITWSDPSSIWLILVVFSLLSETDSYSGNRRGNTLVNSEKDL